MNGKNTNPQRRQALKKILAGSSIVGASAVVPDKWVKPVVDVVVLPAHAQPSPAFMLPLNATWAGGGGGNGFGSLEPKSGEGLAMRVLDQIVPAARAGATMGTSCSVSVFACLETVSADQVSVQLSVGKVIGSKDVKVMMNRQFQDTIEDFLVGGNLSDDDKTWTLRVQGECPLVNSVDYDDVDVIFDANRTTSCTPT